jgi:hypothetical protein
VRSILVPGEQRTPRTELQEATHRRRVFLFHTLDKGKADAKPGADVGSMQRPYSKEFKSSGESCTIEASEVSEVSVLSMALLRPSEIKLVRLLKKVGMWAAARLEDDDGRNKS